MSDDEKMAALLTVVKEPDIPDEFLNKKWNKLPERFRSDMRIDAKEDSDGLSFDYITDYSYGISETMTFLIPNFMGGEMRAGNIDHSSEFYKSTPNQNKGIVDTQISSYWGDKGAAAPTYVGAIIMFLFVLGIFDISQL